MHSSYRAMSGLDQDEVIKSRKEYGSNSITQKKRKSFLSQYLESFGDPIIKILLIALAINIIFLFRTSDWYESAGIAVALLIATFVSTISEYGSELAFEKLQEESAHVSCRIKRSGKLIKTISSELVVGDLVLLQTGEKIPADGHIVSGELLVDQSALNGESKEVRKYCVHEDDISDLTSSSGLFCGSVVCQGNGAMIIDKVGDSTFYGKLAIEVQEGKIESPLKARLQKLAGTISKIGYIAAIAVAFANLFNCFVIDSGFNQAAIIAKLLDVKFVFEALISTLTLAISVLVMAVPEGLPMMITVVLSANMKKMLKDNVLVRKLVGIETAGSLNILFTDKTGTLTEGKLAVENFLNGCGESFENLTAFKNMSPKLFSQFLIATSMNTDSQISVDGGKQTVIGGNGTDRAILKYVLPYMKETEGATLLSHVQFNSENKYSLSEIENNGKKTYLIKGAPEIIISKCMYYMDHNGNKKLLNKQMLDDKMHELGKDAIRMLALAQSDAPIKNSSELTLLGIICIRDQLRKEARPAVKQLMDAGIQPVMITGDNKETAIAIAKDIGLIGNKVSKNTVLTSKDLLVLSDAEIKKVLPEIRVIARALPTDKSRLVRLSQELGLVAGMTGDGVNDAPALKKADVGFSMGSGTEVAKEAGDIVIIDNNILSIVKAVLYGRTIFKSIRKFIIFQLTMNFCAVGLSIICPFLGVDAPITVMQMLWVNMIMDTLAGLAFAGEVPLSEYMKEPPKKREESIINKYMYGQILCAGVFTIILCVMFLELQLTRQIFRYGDGTDYFMTAFFALFIFAGVFNSFNARTSRLDITAYLLDNKMFIIVMVLVCIVQIALIYGGGEIFRTIGINILHLQLILALAFTVIPIDILRKFGLRSLGHKGYI